MYQILQGQEGQKRGLKEGFIGEIVLYQDVNKKQRDVCLEGIPKKYSSYLQKARGMREEPSRRTNRKIRQFDKYKLGTSLQSRINSMSNKSPGNFPLVSILFCTFHIFY